MIKFDKPENLNGSELVNELKAVGIEIGKGFPLVDANGKLWLDIDSKDVSKAENVIAAHNGTIIAPEPSIADKLASVGLDLNDLKAALGIDA